jgi:nicotinic acid mononucleotide adenylyltransferase
MSLEQIDREALSAVPVVNDPAPVRWFRPPPPSRSHFVILSGSFNPPTLAHSTLLDAAAEQVGGWPVHLLPVKAIDKEDVSILRVEDRLALLKELGDDAIAVTSVGLYVDQASGFRALSPGAALTFVVGYDKLVQILDPRYYDDRNAALDALFDLAQLVVAPRGDQDSVAVQETIKTDGRRWQNSIQLLAPPPDLDRTLSSSAVRKMPPEALRDEVDDSVRDFLVRLQPFSDPAAYVERWRELDRR